MITVEKVVFLRAVPLFSGLATSEIGRVAGIAEEVVFTSGSRIITQGEHGDSMFLIAEGEVRVHIGESQLAVLTRNDFFGEMSLLDYEPRSASVTALTDCLLLRIGQRDFQRVLFTRAEVAQAIIRTLTRRLRKAEGELMERSRTQNGKGNAGDAQ